MYKTFSLSLSILYRLKYFIKIREEKDEREKRELNASHFERRWERSGPELRE